MRIAVDYDWHAFYKGNLIQKWWKRRVARAVWEFMPEGSTVLDVGCGSSPIITQYPGAIGIDSDHDKIEFMKKRCPEQSFRQMSAYSLDFPDSHFDKVLCIEVLEHLDADISLLQQRRNELVEEIHNCNHILSTKHRRAILRRVK